MANLKKKKSLVKAKKITKKKPAKLSKAKTKSVQKKIPAKKGPEKAVAPVPTPVAKIKVKEPFKKEIVKRLLKEKEVLLTEVAEKIKN